MAGRFPFILLSLATIPFMVTPLDTYVTDSSLIEGEGIFEPAGEDILTITMHIARLFKIDLVFI